VSIALRTPRLLLREWRDDDRAPFATMWADPEVMAFYAAPLADRAASDAWIEGMRRHNDEHGFAYWAVEHPGKSDLIGAIGLTRVRALPFAPAVEIGWRLARQYWGHGYATEAARAVLDDGFGRLDLPEIVAFTVPANNRSWRVMERLGMTRDPAGNFDHPRIPEGNPLRRHILYRIRRAGS
jgi:RimJ/RimL family protein N-acetyltransferase